MRAVNIKHHKAQIYFGATFQCRSGQILDTKYNLCPSPVQVLSNPCLTSVHVQGLSGRCPIQVKGLSSICQGPVKLK